MVRKKDNRTINGTLRPFYRWHRRIGIISAVFFLILAITGLILNHNVGLNLNKTYLSSEWLHNWYGLPVPEEGGFEGLTADRVLLDIHTGRFFGAIGTLIVDIATICLLFLTGTGFYIWLRSKSEKRKKRK